MPVAPRKGAACHLTLGEVRQLVDAVPAPLRPRLQHALTCTVCLPQARRTLRELAPAPMPGRPRPRVDRELPPRLDSRLRSLAGTGEEDATAAGREALALVEQLLGQPPESQWRVAEQEVRFQAAPVVERLLDLAYEAALADPQEAEHLANLAVRLCGRLGPGTVGAEERRSLLARSWLVAAHALALQGLLDPAERGFRVAADHIAGGQAIEAALYWRLLGELRRR
ncbi:MAG: hypothetical protein ACRD2T_09660, partial [Thermoanaerobaculia bacterium]